MLTVINTLAGLDARDAAEVRRYWSADALRTLYFEPKKLGVRVCDEALDGDIWRGTVLRSKAFSTSAGVRCCATICDGDRWGRPGRAVSD